LGFLLCFAYT
jgi:hypothetical protein